MSQAGALVTKLEDLKPGDVLVCKPCPGCHGEHVVTVGERADGPGSDIKTGLPSVDSTGMLLDVSQCSYVPRSRLARITPYGISHGIFYRAVLS